MSAIEFQLQFMHAERLKICISNDLHFNIAVLNFSVILFNYNNYVAIQNTILSLNFLAKK